MISLWRNFIHGCAILFGFHLVEQRRTAEELVTEKVPMPHTPGYWTCPMCRNVFPFNNRGYVEHDFFWCSKQDSLTLINDEGMTFPLPGEPS